MAALRLSLTASLSTCDAIHEALITDVVVAMAREFGVRLDEPHADTTSVSFSGQYPDQVSVSIRGQRPPFITRGFNKDHRPDLKRLLLTGGRRGYRGPPLR